MATKPRTAREALAAGSDALRRGAWREAREHFQAALAGEETGDAWEGLGWAGWWLHDPELTLRARECAYRAFRGADDRAGAGRVAAWLASDYLEFRGEDAVARGWLERSHRMLDDLPEGEAHGWLALNEGAYFADVGGDLERSAALAARARPANGRMRWPRIPHLTLTNLRSLTIPRPSFTARLEPDCRTVAC